MAPLTCGRVGDVGGWFGGVAGFLGGDGGLVVILGGGKGVGGGSPGTIVTEHRGIDGRRDEKSQHNGASTW